MGLEGVLGMGLLASTFDVESVVLGMGLLVSTFDSLGGAHTFLFSMGLEGGFGMGLLALTFDVESVVFLKRG